ncbi:L-2-amino-thiazoline-4-carboxylic acid hydrolase [Desulfosporosinus youngiae]|uniref:L-2-amino-thiazoline-4-carboxylic acid hydrolase n=1 Tax=Desulfosporosinus youngiae TaxID=339862 RepID=UPI00145E844C|nr:L-2-amino-thiazoline-4-carboxylic acid hydrolase [Desulfosporosinus youngiae]
MAEEDVIKREEAALQVRQMGKMMASLFYHMAKEVLSELGEVRGTELVGRAIKAYGSERGEQHRERVLAAGIEHLPENYVELGDLPYLGWDVEKVVPEENKTHIKITYCPLAEYWQEKGAAKIGRLYCGVDQAKYEAFHPDSEYIHLKNRLDGDECCEMVCRQKQAMAKVKQIRDDCRKRLIPYTLKAFAELPAMEDPQILDMGCGSGVPALTLLETYPGRLWAVDTDAESLEWLREKAQARNLAARINIIRASLFDVSLPGESFDIVLAEGMLNVVGFEKGLPALVRFLKPGGYLIIHDELTDDEAKQRIFARHHLEVLQTFELDANVWWQGYFACLEALIQREETISLYEKELGEISDIKNHPEQFCSVYHVLRKSFL